MAKLFGGASKPKSPSPELSVQPSAVASNPQAEAMRQTSHSPSPQSVKEDPRATAESRARTLVVGPQIVLSGEVKSCNRLVVQGTIRANIKECRDIAIAEGGLFFGSAAVQNAEISGRFEGDLKVSQRLLIRAPGLVSGTVQYREIEIERGGRIAGDVSAIGPTDQRAEIP